MIFDYLDKRYSTRNLSDEQFENIIETLAVELSQVDYRVNHTEDILLKDWQALKRFNCVQNDTSSTTRVGMKLCEHFFPNFYNIKNPKGESFANSWNKDNLIKVLRWNRKSHSTPYLSEIKRGIYFCTGLTKNTMFRPHLAKTIASSFRGDTVLDPCCGWGGRMLGTVASGKNYIGFEPNKETFDNLTKLIDFLDINNQVKIYNVGAEYMNEYINKKVDIVMTSPPYFNLEIYSEEKTQSENQYNSYLSWKDVWLTKVISDSLKNLKDSGVSCWNVHNVSKMNMIEDVRNIHQSLGYMPEKTFSIGSSKRQSNQGETKNEKSKDLTICYKK